ncbi:hypothetical protein MJ1_0190 [Nanobdella aerobiophila]|uniref:Uncharacterized protein n=1 Tax=Nanobdella aerobiophila TaxID=2586965 RepID=A0A915WRA9_9ARCH|nr:hypothetical protein [Nanobdella aerobiophila]BBL45363.1 hypothetical protein MJ1_0190 [Nanobdella aerobiophila]
MRSDALTVIIIIMGIVIVILLLLVLFVPAKDIFKGSASNNYIVSYKVSYMYYSNYNIYAVIYNNGNVNIDPSKYSVQAEYYPYGYEYNCNIDSNGLIYNNSQSTVVVNCTNNKEIFDNLLSNNGYYIFSFNYNNNIETYNLSSDLMK